MTNNEIIGKFLDDFEDEQLRLLLSEPSDLSVQRGYRRVIGVMYDVREFLSDYAPSHSDSGSNHD